MSEELTHEETAALQAMQADTAPVAAEEVAAPEPAVAEPAPAEPAAAGDEDPGKPAPGQVPIGAMHQERERRKEAERQLQDMQRQMAEFQARLEAAQPEQPIVVPDPVLEPEKFKQWQIDQIKARSLEMQQLSQRQTEAQQEMQLMQRLTHDAAQFKQTTPDYDDAFQHAVKGRQEELSFYGYSAEQIAQQIEVDVRALVGQAYSQGKNPAELFYTYAKMRGYAPKTPDPVPAQAAAQVTAFANAQRQTQSLAQSGGPSNDGGVTLESMAKMSEAELAAMPKAKRDEMLKKVMGG